jgi:hypothetical protein
MFRFDIGEDGAKTGHLIGWLCWLAGMGIQFIFGWVVDDCRIAPIEVMGREVIPAIAGL